MVVGTTALSTVRSIFFADVESGPMGRDQPVNTVLPRRRQAWHEARLREIVQPATRDCCRSEGLQEKILGRWTT
jgi:hypothetical protein